MTGAIETHQGSTGAGRTGGEPVAPRPAMSVLITVRGALGSAESAAHRIEVVLGHRGEAAPMRMPATRTSWIDVAASSSRTPIRTRSSPSSGAIRPSSRCRAVGLAGYPELRIALARAALWEESGQAPGHPTTGQIDPGDSLADVVAKITHADECAIADTAAALDLVMLEQAVAAVAGARRVDIYGIAASGLVGADLHQKLHRIGKISFVWSDPHLALTSAAVLGSADVAVGISHTGTTVDTLDALRVARTRGATTIASGHSIRACRPPIAPRTPQARAS